MTRAGFALLLLLPLAACGKKREDKVEQLREAQARTAVAEAEAAKAQFEAKVAQDDLDKALAEKEAVLDSKADLERELAEAQQQKKELLEQATKKLAALKKQRDALPDGPERQTLDKQIEELTKLVKDTQTPP